MFSINPIRKVTSNLPEITDNYTVLLADENPILYSGTNRLGNRILGVIVGESEDDFSIRYFHFIISDFEYYSFIKRTLSLREIIDKSDILFIIDFVGDVIKEKHLMPVLEIPKEYLPRPNSFCPKIVFSPSFDYGFSLKGKMAEEHLVEVGEASSIQIKCKDVLRKTLDIVKQELGYNPRVLLSPYTKSSFRLNYKIEFDNTNPSLFHPKQELVAKYINSYLSYIVDYLPTEDENILRETGVSSDALKQVEDNLIEVLKSANYGFEENKIEQELLNSINDSAQKFEEITNEIKSSSSFDVIEVVNYEASGNVVGLGKIDRNFYDTIKSKLPPKDNPITDKIEMDIHFKKYRIRIYSFNTDSGHCLAEYYYDQSENFIKLPIRITKGDKSYHNSIFSKALDHKQIITISARAERKNGKIRSLHTKL